MFTSQVTTPVPKKIIMHNFTGILILVPTHFVNQKKFKAIYFSIQFDNRENHSALHYVQMGSLTVHASVYLIFSITVCNRDYIYGSMYRTEASESDCTLTHPLIIHYLLMHQISSFLLHCAINVSLGDMNLATLANFIIIFLCLMRDIDC